MQLGTESNKTFSNKTRRFFAQRKHALRDRRYAIVCSRKSLAWL
jgi:hypothetical protein